MERILKAARGKQLVTYREVPIKLLAVSKSHEIFSQEKQGPTAKIALPSKDIIENQMADKELSRQEKKKTKRVRYHQALII